MNSSQIADDMERWTELFFIMCEGEAPHNKAHWNLRLALSTFATDVAVLPVNKTRMRAF